jgi:hypothetical protein
VSPRKVRTLTDSPAAERVLKAILKPWVDRKEIHISYLLGSASIVLARQSLLEHPERPVALVLSADTTNAQKAFEDRASVQRMLGSAYPDNWYVAIVIPKVSAWALADPRIKSEFDAGELSKSSEYQQAIRISELVKEKPFDLDALRKVSPDFRGLEDFLNRYAESPQAVVQSGLG